ncbi:MAG: hypothetical protein QNK17_09910 [Hyphomicrobiaceae bacterium]|nr:hypothetical protein [Hyphomicrobiaceae bacterium]MDX2450727.1 hypothetical protein [Hyphomicrobiaceae bacterium]
MAFTVNGGTVKGTSTFGDLTVNNGMLAPGNSIGTMTVNGVSYSGQFEGVKDNAVEGRFTWPF